MAHARVRDRSATQTATPMGDRPHALPVVKRRHPSQWFAAAVVLVLVAVLLSALVRSPNIDWQVVREHMTAESILDGVVVTILLTLISTVVGILLGLPLAVMRLSDNVVLKGVSVAYVWFFRGVPLLVQLIFWFNLALIFPRLSLGVPFTNLTLVEGDTNVLVSGFVAALLGLGLSEAAFMSEIIRGGILSIDKGQIEAGYSLGLTQGVLLRRILIPQAMRVIVPPMGNDVIIMLKTTALVSVISGSDLLTNAQTIYQTNFRVIELLIVASIWYLALTTLLSIGQHYLEKFYGRGFGHVTRSRRRRAAPVGSELR